MCWICCLRKCTESTIPRPSCSFCRNVPARRTQFRGGKPNKRRLAHSEMWHKRSQYQQEQGAQIRNLSFVLGRMTLLPLESSKSMKPTPATTVHHKAQTQSTSQSPIIGTRASARPNKTQQRAFAPRGCSSSWSSQQSRPRCMHERALQL